MVNEYAAPGWHSFREYGRFTYYHESFLAARNADPRFLRVVAICLIFTVAVVVAVLGIRGRERWFSLLKTVCTLYVGVALLLGLHGKYWQVGYITTKHACIAPGRYIPAMIGVNVGLTAFNITLDGFYPSEDSKPSENLYLSEEFEWADRLSEGRIAIKEFEAIRQKGLPFALVTVADHLTCDFGGWRWARRNRQAGYYAHICLWTAFAVWLLCNISFSMVVAYGAKQMLLCGILTLLGIILYSFIQPEVDMSIAFEDGTLTLHYGWCYWMVVAAGIESTLIGLIIMVINVVAPRKAAAMFGLRSSDDEYYYYDEYDSSIPRTPLMYRSYSYSDNTPRESPNPSPRMPRAMDFGVVNPVFEDDAGHLAVPRQRHTLPRQEPYVNPETNEATSKKDVYDSGLNSPASKGSSEQGSDADPKEKLNDLKTDSNDVVVDIGGNSEEADDKNATHIDLTQL